MAYGLPGFSVRGILQARILEWVAFPFCRGSSQPRDRTWVCYIEGRFFTAWATCKYTETLLWLLLLLLSQSLQSCPTLCDPIDGSPPGSPVPGILQAKHECVAISFSNAWKWKVKVKSLDRCPTLSDPMDCSLPGSCIHGILQARVLEWGAIAFSNCFGIT